MEDAVPFNMAAVASLHSQLSGVLAGFAFTTFIYYLTSSTRHAKTDRVQRAVVASLFTAIVGLVVCSFLYAVLAGTKPTSGAATTAALLYGLTAGMAVLLLFYSMTLLASRQSLLVSVVRAGRYLVGIAGPSWIMGLLVGSTMTARVIRCSPACIDGKPSGPGSTSVVGAILTIILLCSSITLVWTLKRRGSSAFIVKATVRVRGSQATIPVLVTVLAAVGGSVVFPALGNGFQPSDGLLIGLLTFCFLSLISFATISIVALHPVAAEDSLESAN